MLLELYQTWVGGEALKLRKLTDDLFVPSYDGYSIVNFSNLILEHFGSVTFHEPFPLERSYLSGAEKVVVMVLDGVGYEKFVKNLPEDPTLKVYPCTSVFPTTTATALPSIYSGLTPLEHGFLGYLLYLKETGCLVNVIDMSPPGYPRDTVLRNLNTSFRTIFQVLSEKGVKSFFLVPRHIAGSGFSKIMSVGAEQVPFSGFGDMIQAILDISDGEGKKLIFSYWPSCDSVAHRSGVGKAYEMELRWFVEILKKELLRKLRPDTTFFLLSDHGVIETLQENEIWWDNSSEVMKFLERPPSGEQRMMYLHTRRKRTLVEYLVEKYKDLALFLDPKEHMWLFGKGRRHWDFFERVGDVVLIARGNHSFNYRYTGKEESLKGRHGSLTKDELLVPLAVYRR